MAKNKTQRPLRLAFIGTGLVAGLQIDSLKLVPDIEVTALCDIDPKALAKTAEKTGLPASACYTDHKKMLKHAEYDAVSVCTPNGAHLACSVAASKAGAHVLVEKPMALNAGECRKMMAAADDAGKKLVVGFQFRYDPKTQYLRRQVEEGVLGDIVFGRVQALRRRGIPNWGVFGRKELQGGGPLIDIGVHILEMAHYTMGSPKPVAASGMTSTYLGNRKEATQTVCKWPGWDYKRYTVEDLAVGHIRFENGAVIHLEASFAGHFEKDAWDFQLMGTRGGCRWDKAQVFTDRHGYQVDESPGYLPDMDMFTTGFSAKLAQFADHCLNDTPAMVPAEHGLMVQQMLDGVYRSAERGGKEVAIR